MEKKMETTRKNMETTIACWGYIGDKGKENGNYYSILGLYWVIWRPSYVVPFWVWYGFLVRILIRTTKKVLHWRV